MINQTTCKSCLNWKIVAAVILLAVTAWFLFRDRLSISALFPFLLFLICPLSMMFMMKSMHQTDSTKEPTPPLSKTPPSSDRVK